jgi:hypothetical protein
MGAAFSGIVHQTTALLAIAAIKDTGFKIGGRLALNQKTVRRGGAFGIYANPNVGDGEESRGKVRFL